MSGEQGMRVKAEIIAIGVAYPHEPHELGIAWTVSGWAMAGGDFPGFDAATGTAGGWTPAELAMIAETARVSSTLVAFAVAGACRAAPPEPGAGATGGPE